MKKRFLILSATLLLCCLVFISVSCASEEVIQTETDFAINEIILPLNNWDLKELWRNFCLL